MEAFFSSELIAILAGVLSIILAVIAIGLSVHFYNQGKAAEKSVAVALASIEAQATILSRITEKHMGQLISSVTDTTMIEKVMDT